MTRTSNLTFAIAGALALVAIGYRSGAARPVVVAQAASIATVDLERLVRSLDAYARANEGLEALAKKLDDEGTARRDEIRRLGEDMEMLPPGSANRDKAQSQVLLKSHELRTYLDYATRTLNEAQSFALRKIYQNIKDEAAAFAQSAGFDVVFVDDSVVDLPEAASEAEMMRQISARRMLYTGVGIDVTDELIKRLNARNGD